jgi:hypothetical protein
MKLDTLSLLGIFSFISLIFFKLVKAEEDHDEIQICGGFIEIDLSENPNLKSEIDLSSIVVSSYTTDMITKEHTNVAQSGYYFLPVYEKESLMVKVSGPNGMIFEPDQYIFNVSEDTSISDYCKDDNNYKFTGYTVEGQLSTFGTIEGPEGVEISLFKYADSQKTSKTKIQDALTYEKGDFKFNPVYPGNYLLKPTNQKDEDKFDPNYKELNFEVKVNKLNYLERALIIRGYSVSGQIFSDNQPEENVLALIYSFNSTLTSAYECQFKFDFERKDTEYKGLKPFCAVKTDNTGSFTFMNIPYGQFLIRPFYKEELVSFDIYPQETAVEVMHKSQIIETPFIVKSLSIKGKVINSNGNGISGVTIKVDGIDKTVTDKSGFYTLNNIVSGNYDLEAHTDDMFFDPIQNLKISTSIKSLPNFVVKDYKLCGKIHIETSDSISTVKRAVLLKEKETNTERRTVTDIHGKYCFVVKPSVYHIQPLLSQEEKDAELHLTPESIDIEIVDEPKLNVNFYQSKVEISGSITCLKECQPDMKVFLTSLKKSERVISVNIEPIISNNNKMFSFTFSNILSGQYKLSIQKFEWCWDQEESIIKVQNEKISNLKFNQVGYSLFYNTQYDIKIDWINIKENKNKGANVLKKTESKICLPMQGEYNIYPKSCHKFEKEFYVYNTEKKERLELVPREFLVNGSIGINNKIHSSLSKEDINQLKLKVSVEEIKANSLSLYKSIDNIKTSENNILFHFYTKPKTNLLISPEIILENSDAKLSKNLIEKLPNLLFFPKFKQIRIEESCSENYENLKFEMRSGLIIYGSISPAMEGVRISALNKETGELVSSTESLESGKYKIGPLYTEFEYDIKAVKEGYKIWATEENMNVFKAEKLSFLRVKIVDTNDKPLSSVFLSLSSSNRGFKINNNTNADGYFDFLELYSGEYYIKPLFKEYKFEPSQKAVSIKGGEHIHETIVAHRVAFSIFGKSKFFYFS